MVVQIIDDFGVSVDEAKRDPPVSRDFHGVQCGVFGVQLMQVVPRLIYFVVGLGMVKIKQYFAQSLRVFRLYPPGVPSLEEAFKPFVNETDYHFAVPFFCRL